MAGGVALVVTDNAFMGLTSAKVAVHDRIVLSPGAKLPVLLMEKESYWNFLGFAWVHGMEEEDLHKAWAGLNIPEEQYFLR